jgi:MFS family permease
MVCTAIAEVPAGAAADRFGRRSVLMISSVLTGIGLVVLGASRTTTFAGLAMIVLALARAAASGILESWFVDCLGDTDEEGSVSEGIAVGMRAEFITQAASGILAAILLTFTFTSSLDRSHTE